jgi:multidrug transporter EmrE-like cation transporter
MDYLPPLRKNILLLTIAELIGDTGYKYAAEKSTSYLPAGISGYIGVQYYLYESLKEKNLLYTNAVWNAYNTVLESAWCYFYLGERLKDGKEYLGLGLIIAGLFLIN